MFQFKTLLDQPAPSRVVLMPLAPAAAVLPLQADSNALLPFLQEVARLHLAAFIGLYGVPPSGLRISKMQIAEAGEPLRPHYACSFKAPLSTQAALWLDAFRDGLESWNEAHFPDPICTESEEPGMTTYAVAPFDEAIKFACYRWHRERRIDALRAIGSYFSDEVPDHLNPSSRYFTPLRN
jgi:hypothetical protein